MKRPPNRSYEFAARAALLGLVAATILPWPRVRAAAQVQDVLRQSVLMQAMRDELKRTQEELQMEGLDKPYFVAYTVRQSREVQATATFGALLGGWKNEGRRLDVEVRVGSPSFDNTNFRRRSLFSSGPGAIAFLPLEDDYRELRREIWLATDSAYKAALDTLAQKRATLQTQTRTEDTPDFTSEEPLSLVGEPGPPAPSQQELESLVRTLSGSFRDFPDVFESSVTASFRDQTTFYVNSEGSTFVRYDPAASVFVHAQTQASDGTPLNDEVTANGPSWPEIADLDVLQERVREMGASLAARRSAPGIDRYSGPVLFEGEAAAELIAGVLLPRLLGTPGSANPFLDRLGARVLPRFLSIRDDPTLNDSGFAGGYEIDDDGVAARSKAVVENGFLRTLLTTRNPIPGVDRSTGNRRGQGPRASNLLVESTRGLSKEALRKEFMALVEERGSDYGIVVRSLDHSASASSRLASMASLLGRQQEQSRGRPVQVAYKVHHDGKEELLTKAELVAVTEATFRDIVSTSEASTLYTFLSGSRGGIRRYLGSSDSLVSISTPDLLFEEMTVKKPGGHVPRPPAAKHPYFDR